jgi:hypothetical protein
MTRTMAILDIETKPMLLWQFDLKVHGYINPEMIHTPRSILCFSWKWLGEDGTHFASEWTDGPDGMARILFDLLDEAEIVCGWNSKRFDVPEIFTFIMLAGLDMPSPFQQLDLLACVRKRFRFASNRLGEVAKVLDTPRKLEHSGFSLWTRTMDGDEDARAEMESYNRADVEATEAIYLRLQGWLPSHPNVALIDGQERACPVCGSGRLVYRGYAATSASTFRRLQCRDCKAWSREARRAATTDLRAA